MSFAKNLREIILFFSHNKKCKIVIFEDIDRFPRDVVLKLMEELKKLNNQINSSDFVSQKVNFIYTFKDDIFKNKEDKSKFYDYIISVMPVSSYYNSFTILKELLKEVNKENDINDDLIELLADSVYDYRTLTSIVNDYDLFKDIHDEIDANKLFAMIIIKNYYLNEYSDILEHDNFINDRFAKIEKAKIELISNINSLIKEENEKIYNIKYENELDLKEIKQIFWENCNSNTTRASYIKNTKTGKTYNYQEFLSNFDIEDLREEEYLFDGYYKVDYSDYGSEEDFFDKLKSKDSRIKVCQSIIDDLSSQKFDLENKLTEEQYKKYIENQTVELVDRLIISGYIGRDFVDYITSPSSCGITSSENTYIFNVKHNNESILTPIENYELVVERIMKHTKCQYVLNIYVIDYVFNNDNHKCIRDDLLKQFIDLNEYRIKVLYNLYKEKNDCFYVIMEYLVENNVDIWEKIKYLDDYIKEFLVIGLINTPNGIKLVDDMDSFVAYLNLLFNDYSKVQIFNNENIFENIKELLDYKLRIKDISVYNYKIQDIIKEHAMFEYNDLNMKNIFWNKKNIIESYKDDNKYGDILVDHIKNNFILFYDEYYFNNKDIILGKFNIEILQSELPLNIKKELYQREKFIIDVAFIKEKDLFPLAVKYNHLPTNWSTIYSLYKKVSNDILVDFILNNKEELLNCDILIKEKDLINYQFLLKKLVDRLLKEEEYYIINLLRPYFKFRVNSIHDLTNNMILELNKIDMIEFGKAKINRIKNISEIALVTYFKHWVVNSNSYLTVYNKIKSSEDSIDNIKSLLKLDSLSILEKIIIVFKEKESNEVTREYLDIFLDSNKMYEIPYRRSLYLKMTNEYKELFRNCKKVGNSVLFEL